ncbi:hypothetical protein LTR37_012635 [Vermiconidia calcicola]|uniref:Uncharacterized protein n=1 Tax=Vermiconidia calcicola TaxID=1690605 RepID=A0ACC3MYM6_9PEZI|nr:hypothetical protein LTR37_012635 [Vermiconidia calcicola]
MCRNGHSCESKPSSLPYRIIAIEHDGSKLKSKVLETGAQSGKYVALSHCWGLGRNLKTTSANIDRFKRDIPTDDLPRTFHDVIEITWRLGFKYVWIDSLCIIQDSPEDWAVQSADMASIYSKASLTICAAGSSSDQDGVFTARSAVCNPPDHNTGLRDRRCSAIAKAVVNVSSGQTSELSFFPETHFDGLLYNIDHALDQIKQDPLTLRAWAFQERILSSRKLIYGKDQMFWECKECLYSEDGFRGISDIPRVEQLLTSELSTSAKERHKNGWPAVVEAYSHGRLSYVTDRLPALAGLATVIDDATMAAYNAGIWSSHLWADLLWHVRLRVEAEPVGFTFQEDFRDRQQSPQRQLREGEVEREWAADLEKWRATVTPAAASAPWPKDARIIQHLHFDGVNTEGLTLRRPREYVAPTWSFASIDAPVTFSYSFAANASPTVIARCLDIHTRLAAANRYGHVEAGAITIRAPLVPPPEPPAFSKNFFFGSNVSIDIPEYRPPAGREIEQVHFDVEPVLPCWALLITTTHALLIVPNKRKRSFLPKSSTWVRVGMSERLYGFGRFWQHANKEDWIKTVTIV